MPPGNDALAKYFQGHAALGQKVGNDIAAQRALAEAIHLLAAEPTDVTYAEENDLCFQGPGLWCLPIGARTSPNVILYFHGGGYVFNRPASHRKMAAHIGKAADAKVLLVDYRLAPEAQFPSQIDDAVESYRWLLRKGYKPENIATAGDSAGGNLCTAVVLKLRELGEQLPRAVVSISPWYDMEFSGGTMDSNVETDALIRREQMQGLVQAYLPEGEQRNPLAHILAADPKGFPPIYLVAGGSEVLRDNAERFAQSAKAAGVEVELEIGEGMQHVYTFMAGKHEQADQTIANIGVWLQKQCRG